MSHMEYRVVGKVGPDGVEVMTEWFNDTKASVDGVMLGLNIRGWEETGIEHREVEQ